MPLSPFHYRQLRHTISIHGYCSVTREERIAVKEYEKTNGLDMGDRVFLNKKRRWSDVFIPYRRKKVATPAYRSIRVSTPACKSDD